MNVQLSTVSETRKSLVVTLEKDEVDAEHQAVLGEYVRLARLPGFRPGKAPAAMVVKRFAKEIAEEFKQKVVTKAYRGALDKEKLEVLNVVSVEEGAIEPGAPAAITVTVDVRPDFTLPDYVGLPTQVAPVEPTGAEVDEVVQALRSEGADFRPAERAAVKGDYVKLAYEGSLDGKPIAEIAGDKQLYAKVPQTWEEVEGANEGIIPGLGRHLAGVERGSKKKVAVTFPMDFRPVPALAGKTAEYALDIQEVRERILPELNADFFKAHGADGLEGLKGQIRSNLRLQRERRNHAAQRSQVTQALADRVQFEPPHSLVEAETQGVLRQFIEENMRRGVPAEQFEKDKKELFDGARKAAANRVKIELILAKVAEAEKIEVSDGDLDQYIRREAARSKQRPDKLARDLAKDRNALRSAQQSIIFDKSVDFLVSKARVTASQT
ncbi:MAG TPA: trigger factor [Opitutaceae bacterium]|nr:trigger factor [Opitutaceae bacterium]